MITLGIAGLNITLENKFSYVEKLSKNYLSDSDYSDFSVCASMDEILAEASSSPYKCSDEYYESIVLYRNIAEKLPEYDAVVFHGAVIAYEGKAYAVTARSGVGKTTHLKLWLQEFGDKVHILNGDKPILRIIEGKVYACGTPWRGKEGYGVNEMLPLCGIAFITRAAENSAKRLAPSGEVLRLLSQIYVPRSEKGASLALMASNKIISSVPIYEFRVNMERQAAIVARDAFLGLNTSNERIKL